jgi:hypothetical protein
VRSGDGDDDLAPGVTLLDGPDRLRRLGERERPFDFGLELILDGLERTLVGR